MQVIAELRSKHPNYLTLPLVDVLVPVCEDCALYEGLSGAPDIVADGWQIDLLICGFTVEQITRIEEKVEGNPYASVHCSSFCRRELRYGEDNFYVKSIAFEEYCHELIPPSDAAKNPKVRKWMKRLIFEVYEGKCFACGTALNSDDNSIDHILPFSEGGLSELMNLQPLCKRHSRPSRS